MTITKCRVGAKDDNEVRPGSLHVRTNAHAMEEVEEGQAQDVKGVQKNYTAHNRRPYGSR
eukprot:2890319-Pyramimonas_sp.AAC.1